MAERFSHLLCVDIVFQQPEKNRVVDLARELQTAKARSALDAYGALEQLRRRPLLALLNRFDPVEGGGWMRRYVSNRLGLKTPNVWYMHQAARFSVGVIYPWGEEGQLCGFAAVPEDFEPQCLQLVGKTLEQFGGGCRLDAIDALRPSGVANVALAVKPAVRDRMVANSSDTGAYSFRVLHQLPIFVD